MFESIRITNSRIQERVNKFMDANCHLLAHNLVISPKFDESHKQFTFSIANGTKELSVVFCIDKTLIYRKSYNKNKCFIVVSSLVRYRHFDKDYRWLTN